MNSLGQSSFCHLHVHTEYSLLDGSIKIKKLVQHLAKTGASACAITDHDAMHGALEFFIECKKKNIKGIIGYEANVSPWTPGLPNRPFHLILLAKNTLGYENLIKICTFANTKGKEIYGDEYTCVSWEVLNQYSGGLICLTGCMKGEFSSLISSQEFESARTYITKLISIFGKDNIFIELIDNNIAGQMQIIRNSISLANQMNVRYVATCDVHYLDPEDQDTHLSLLAIKHKLQRADTQSIDTSVEFHMKSDDEMQRRFQEWPEAISNSFLIAQQCNVEIDTQSIFMPDFRLRPEETADECLVRLAWSGLEERKETIQKVYKTEFTDEKWDEYRKRLQYELEVILKMKFSGYFLIVQDFINWAKDNQIPVGPGRGSAAGSLVTYALKITNIDPIRFNLLFERFLNPERISMPDIDTDFCQDRRDQVLEYVYQRYGRDNVSQIVTFGRLMAKNAIKGLARITGWSFHESNEFAKLIPEVPGITLEKAIEIEDRIKQKIDVDDRSSQLWHGALKIEGTLNSLGIHAAGVIISDRPLYERCPLMESEGQILTQFENKYAEKVGLIKFDFLGLKTLTVIDHAVQLVRKKRDPNFSIDEIELDEPAVYELISSAHVTGIFQLESAGMRKLISELKPSCFTDIVAVLALFRPGPLGSGMVEDFVHRKHGKKRVEYLLPQLAPILQDTYGVIVYQEQVQKIAAELALYTLGEADLLRRAMGKKDKDEMARQKARFISGATKNNIPEDKSSEIFDLMAKFAEYGFNKSHTAAYGLVTFQTAYLKAKYTTEFMAAIMSCDLDNTDKIVTYVRDCRRLNIKLLPPCVNTSEFAFTIPSPNTIQFGLGAIKGIGSNIIQLIVENREKHGPFETIPEFISRVDPRKLNKKVIESLVKAGAFDTLASNRAEIYLNSDIWLRSIANEMDKSVRKGSGLFEVEPTSQEAKERDVGTDAEIHSNVGVNRLAYDPWRLKTRVTAVKDVAEVNRYLLGVQVKACKPWSFVEQLQNEMQTLGFTISGHASDPYRIDIGHCSEFQLDQASHHLQDEGIPDHKRKTHRVAGIVVKIIEKRTKDNSRFCVIVLEDGWGELEIVIFPKQFSALEMSLSLGQAVWVDCKLKKGIEEGSCRGVCQAIGSLDAFRCANVTHVIANLKSHVLKTPETLMQFVRLLSDFRGTTPVYLQSELESERVKLIAENACSPIILGKQLIDKVDSTWPGLIELIPQYDTQSPVQKLAHET